MLKSCLLFSIAAFLAVSANSQSQILSGYLRDSITHFAITNGKVTNLTSKKTVWTDASGFFRLDASVGDLIFAVAPLYRFDTLSYSMLFMDTISIFLVPAASMLPAVTVTSRYNRYQVDSIARRTEFEQNRGTTYNAISKEKKEGFGLTINLDRYLKARYRNKKSSERVFNQVEKNAYVDYRYPPQLVSMYTGLKGEVLKAFMQRNTPAYDWLRQHPSNEEVMFYINERLKAERKSK